MLRDRISPTRRAGPVGDERPAERSDRESHDRAGESERGRLRNGQERELPAAGAVPGEPAAGGGEIGAKRHRRQEREREQQRGRLAADDAEPAPGGPAGGLGLSQLLDRRDQVEARRHGLELGARTRDAGGEVVHLPQPRASGFERSHPRIAAKDDVESGSSGERPHALGEEERRRRRPVIAGGACEGRAHLGCGKRVVGRRQEVAEQQPALQGAGPDLDQLQALRLGQPSGGSTQAEHLAALGAALRRQPSRAKRHLRAEALDAAEAGKGAPDRALAEEDERARIGGDHVPERGARAALEDGLRLGALGGNAEPDGPHRPRAVRDPLDRLRDGAILGDEGARPAADDDRGAGRDAEDDEDDRPTPVAEPRANQPERVEHRAEQASCRGPLHELGHDRLEPFAAAGLELAERLRRLAQLLDEIPGAELARCRLDQRQQLRRPRLSARLPPPAAARYESRAPSAGAGATAQSAWISAASAAERSTSVGWSGIRTSIVPSRGCGRASHQLRV